MIFYQELRDYSLYSRPFTKNLDIALCTLGPLPGIYRLLSLILDLYQQFLEELMSTEVCELGGDVLRKPWKSVEKATSKSILDAWVA